MTAPKLSVKASGLGGRGYKNPFTGQVVPSVTTCLGALEKPGVLQWSVDQVAAYAVMNIESLLNRSEEQGFRMLRFYHSRAKERDFDDPLVDLHNAHSGVLNDLAELGTSVHEWVEAHFNGWIEPDLYRDEQVQMVEAFLRWLETVSDDLEIIATEATLFNTDNAGTCDLIVRYKGQVEMWDTKTSRATRTEHIAQLAALGAMVSWAVEVPEGTEGAVEHVNSKKEKTYWVEKPLPPISAYRILHIRPDDRDSKGNFIPAFCELKSIDQRLIDSAFGIFRASLAARLAQAEVKAVEKAIHKEESELLF